MNNLTPFDLGWLVGMYEGEGCLVPHSGRSWSIAVSSVDRDVIERLHVLTGVGHVGFKRRQQENWQDQWSWRVTVKADIFDLVQAMRPHLSRRRWARTEDFIMWMNSPHAASPPRVLSDTCRKGHPKVPGEPCRPCGAARTAAYRSRLRTA